MNKVSALPAHWSISRWFAAFCVAHICGSAPLSQLFFFIVSSWSQLLPRHFQHFHSWNDYMAWKQLWNKKENMFSMTFSVQAEKHSVLEKCFSVVFKATFFFRVCFVGCVGEHVHRKGAVKVIQFERKRTRSMWRAKYWETKSWMGRLIKSVAVIGTSSILILEEGVKV